VGPSPLLALRLHQVCFTPIVGRSWRIGTSLSCQIRTVESEQAQ
jgi:hypothetical protein